MSDETAGGAAGVRTVSGSVLFLERIALPSGAVLTVRLLDVTRADAPATVLAAAAYEVTGQVPIPYALTVDPAQVDAHASMTIWARLRTSVGTWQTDSHHAVDDDPDKATVDVIVRRLPEE